MEISNEIKQVFESVPFMAFSTVNNAGVPNVVVIGSKKIINKNTIWVIDTFFNKTKENILQNKNVAIALWKDLKGYQIKGTSTYHSEGDIFEEAKDWILQLKPDKIVKGLVEIKVKEIFSITPAYGEAGEKIL